MHLKFGPLLSDAVQKGTKLEEEVFDDIVLMSCNGTGCFLS